MTLLKPVWMQATGGDPALQYSANELREFLRGLVVSDGILDAVGGSLQVTQRGAGANFSVDVAAGHCAILGDDVTDQGMYLARSTAAVNLVIPAPPGSGTRVHRVVAQIRDKTHSGSWTTYDWTPVVLPDVGSGTPALPLSAIPLARVSVAAAQASVLNANITDDRANARLVTGSALVASASGRPANPYTGETIFRTDLLDRESWNGFGWVLHGLNRPFARLRRITSNQTIVDSTLTALAWNSEDADTHNAHDLVTNIQRYTAQIPGVYDNVLTVPWALNINGRREVSFRVNGSVIYNASSIQASSNTRLISQGSRKITMAAGDYIEAMCFQTAGVSLDADRTLNDGWSWEITWMRP